MIFNTRVEAIGVGVIIFESPDRQVLFLIPVLLMCLVMVGRGGRVNMWKG